MVVGTTRSLTDEALSPGWVRPRAESSPDDRFAVVSLFGAPSKDLATLLQPLYILESNTTYDRIIVDVSDIDLPTT